MLSGNGRHRRPRQAPALLVAAGVTGSAIAIPLLGAAGASAADGTTWDRVAECETGGAWSENDGNGYYGGLQMSQENWDKYGGLAYAPTADQASRQQQIAVAEKVLADQGTVAWPTCGPLSGLGRDSASADVDTGVGGDSSSGSGSSDTSDSPGLLDSIGGSADSSIDDPSASPSPSGLPDKADTTNSEDTSGSGTESDAKSDTSSDADASKSQETGSSPTETPRDDESDNSGQSEGSSALTDTGPDAPADTAAGTGRHRGDSADEGAVDGSYTVRPGDSLSVIADSLDLSGGWRGLYAENKSTLGNDPDLIIPGQTLEVGVESGEK
jgi:hypothetical protein